MQTMRTILLFVMAIATTLAAQDSLPELEARVKANKKDGEAWLRLGQLYFEAGLADSTNNTFRLIDKAQKAYHNAIKRTKSAEAYYGLGSVYLHRCRVKHQSVYCLRVESNLKKAIKKNKEFAPAYLALAEWYRDAGMEDRMIDLLEQYVALRPDDVEGRYSLALTYNELFDFESVLDLVGPAMTDFPGDNRWLALMAQATAARGDADRSLGLFGEYLSSGSDAERWYYEDLSNVAQPGELDGFADLPEDQRRAVTESFWRRRDPTLTSAGRARRAEHYRRVWYARNYFSEHVTPWDSRGDVYIRYGEPEYRSRSDRVNSIPSPIVQTIKERNAGEIYGWDLEQWLYDSGQSLDELQALHGITFPDAAGTAPTYPVGAGPAGDPKPWESWVYTQVGGGMEIVFTDEAGRGSFDYAPPPPIAAGSGVLAEIGAKATRFTPGYVMASVSESKPDHFTLPPGVEPLEFYYDVASFRGPDGSPDESLEIYFGIPPEQLTGNGATDGVVLTRTVVLATEAGRVVDRQHDRLAFRGLQAMAAQRGAFIPELSATQVPPGDYRLAVQLTDSESGRWGIYLQDVTVVSYRDSLAISDIELAWMVSEEGRADKYRKGDVRVIPMASRSYRTDQNVFLYYEVYNLLKDEFGRTRYEVSYTIKRDIRRGATLFGGLAKLFDNLFTNREPQFSVSYDRSGDLVNEPVYLELDTQKLKPGMNQVEVTVRDLVRGGLVTKTAVFRLDSESEGRRVKSAFEDLSPQFMDNPEGRRGRRRRR